MEVSVNVLVLCQSLVLVIFNLHSFYLLQASILVQLLIQLLSEYNDNNTIIVLIIVPFIL